MSVEVRAAEVNIMFSEAYDAMPALPRPLASKHDLVYITANGLMLEALSVAPINKGEEKMVAALKMHHVRAYEEDDEMLRIAKRMAIYLRRAHEFVLVNEELYAGYQKKRFLIDKGVLAIGAAVTYCLSIGFGGAWPGLATVIAGVLKSWGLYSKYDLLEQSHFASMKSFEVIRDSCSKIIAGIAECDEEKVFELVDGGEAAAAKLRKAQDDVALDNQAAAAAEAETEALGKPWKDMTTKEKITKVKATAKEYKLKAEAFVQKLKALKEGKLDAQKALTLSVEDGVTEGATPPQVKQRLRVLYRKSVEYRLCHELYEAKYTKLRLKLAFGHLTLSSFTSAVLFLDLDPTVSGLASVALTALTAAMNAVDLAKLESDHQRARLGFASLQRAFATSLMLSTNDDIYDSFPDLAELYLALEKLSPTCFGKELIKNRETKRPLFSMITMPNIAKERLAKELAGLPPVDPQALLDAQAAAEKLAKGELELPAGLPAGLPSAGDLAAQAGGGSVALPDAGAVGARAESVLPEGAALPEGVAKALGVQEVESCSASTSSTRTGSTGSSPGSRKSTPKTKRPSI